MNWRKISELNDLITYEKKNGDFLIRIEARLDGNGKWGIFKNYSFGDTNFLEEYNASTRGDVLGLIKTLMNEKTLTKKQILDIKKQQSKRIAVDIKRSYKEIDTEKWFFNVNKESIKNLFVIYYGRELEIDVVMHEQYKHHEEKIVNEIIDLLGLSKYGDEIKVEIYYYNNSSSRRKNSEEKSKLVEELAIGLGLDEG